MSSLFLPLCLSFCLFLFVFEMGTDIAKASLELYSSCSNLPNARVTGMGRHGQLRLVFKLTLFTDVSGGSMGNLWAGQSFRDEKQEQNTRKTRQGS